jgi:hypothetical protein
VGCHHAESLLDAQVKGAVHAPGDMPTEGAEVTRYRAPSLRLAFVDLLAGLEGSGPQLLQLLLRRVVGRLDRPENHKEKTKIGSGSQTNRINKKKTGER